MADLGIHTMPARDSNIHTGAHESYIRKNPWFVKDACEAIEPYYFD